ncbi:MAG: translocation/assembly module TamB domain-containing protein [Bacteroidetes bacterium]|nr:translocation/assembly module TamB domain-containing protein [Bacteroidota bacterium]
MWHKVKKILYRFAAYTFLLLTLLLIIIFLVINSYPFQTWLGQKASAYMSKEWGVKVNIKKIEIDLIEKINLKSIILYDKHGDTLFCGSINIDVKNYDIKNKKLNLRSIALADATSKLVQYKNEKDLNLQFLIDYFDDGTVSRKGSSKDNWLVDFGNVKLNNVSFSYIDKNSDSTITTALNYSNLVFKKINASISAINLKPEAIEANIKHLSATEQCGLILNNFSSKVRINDNELILSKLNIKMPNSIVNGRVEFHYNEWSDYVDFMDNILIKANLREGTSVSFSDIARFAIDLNGLNKEVKISGLVDGFVSDLKLENLKLQFAEHTKFVGNFNITGLPNIETSYIKFNCKNLSTSYYDLIKIPTYPFNENKFLPIPLIVKNWGVINYRGFFDGFLKDFIATGELNSLAGKIDTDIKLKLGKKPNEVYYEGKLVTTNLNLELITGFQKLNNLNMNVSVKGKNITPEDIDADLKGTINTISYNGYTYKNILLNGLFKDKLFNGLLTSNDPNANFDFNGSINFKNKLPEMDFISTINNLNLTELNLIQGTKADSGIVSSQVLINLKGDNLNNLTGHINFDDTKYKTKYKIYKLSSFDIALEQENIDKSIKLTSSYLNAKVLGTFNLTTIASSANSFLNNYYPTFFPKPHSNKKYNDSLSFSINIKNFKTLSELFIPQLKLSNDTKVAGSINIEKNNFNLNLYSGTINYNGIKINDVDFTIKDNDKVLEATAKGKSIQLTDSLGIENFNLCASSRDKNTKYNFEYGNIENSKNKGQLHGQLLFNNSSIYIYHDALDITISDSTWRLTTTNPTVIDTSGELYINPLVFQNFKQSIAIAGILSNKPGDKLALTFSDLQLNQFNPLLSASKLNLKGILNGSANFYRTDNSLALQSDIQINDFSLNNNKLGKVEIKNNYDSKAKTISIDGYTSLNSEDTLNIKKNISFNGNYYLDGRDESIDINFEAKPANLKIINPYIEGILTFNKGLVVGKGNVHGNTSNIKIDGKLRLVESEVKVDFTNVAYNAVGDIEVMPDQIRFSDFKLNEVGVHSTPQGTLNGNFFHSNFSKMQIDFDVNYKNMMVLNTTIKENKTYYGKMYGSGNLNIYGFLNNLHMLINYETGKNSKFIMPLDGPSEISENDFVKFVKRDTIKKELNDRISGFDLDMNIRANPDAQMKIILDNRTGDGLNVAGIGDIELKINTLGKFEMFGDYIITNGNYLFTLENVINKKFDIVEGSNISWSGDPLNAEISVTTSYKQRASIAPLLNDTLDKSRYMVDCHLKIKDKLFTPNVNFELEFPTIDPTSRSRINNILTDENELNRQVFSFLLFRSFVPPAIYSANSGGVRAGSAAISTGSEMLTNKLNQFLNSYVGNLTGISDLQLGLNYRASTQNTGQGVDLSMSKQFMNNKLSVDGNFGVNNNSTNSQNSSNIIGDINVEYKLSKDGRYKLKGYNKTNDNTQISVVGGPYTQGMGFFYREEFETWAQFVRRITKKKQK